MLRNFRPVLLRNYIGVDATARIHGFRDLAAVIAGDDDRIAGGIDAADNADMTAAAPRHDGDRADLRPGHALTGGCEGTGQIRSGAAMAGALEHEIHERAAPQAARGQTLFTSKHGKDWSCASCHTALPTVAGKHASTAKVIGALAPAFNPERFTDPAKTEKWFRRNCNDVMGRECTAAEKADVLAWLISLKP